ncbi:MAG: aspartate aminotransferase family protein [Pseudomonadota bacterium]|nr:aspartate aminotransferase family protein [Pseudomonadota bacterium]
MNRPDGYGYGPGPVGTNSLRRRDAGTVFHPYSNAVANRSEGPLVITRGEGVYVWDEDGGKYLEAMSGLWCASLGFDEHRLAEAAKRQMRKLPFYHGFNQKSHPPQIELAERLLALAPVPMAKVFFCNSGSEAADTAIKMIWYLNNAIGRPEKKKIISRFKAYHGVTVAAASLTGMPVNHTAFDLPLDGFLHTDMPHYYRFAAEGESEEEFATRCAENLDNLIEAEGPNTVAAFFAEPVMGAGGVVVPPATYFEKIQAVLRKHDVLLVADEVICGFGRTGEMWGSETLGLRPDILTCAKALTSGYLPISAVMINERVFDAIAPKTEETGVFGHGYTYSGHPVPAAVALETLKIYEEMDLIAYVKARSKTFLDRLHGFADHPLVGETMGLGLVGAIELVAKKKSKVSFEPVGTIGTYLTKKAQEQGLILRSMGDRVAFSPPLIISDAEIDEMFQKFRNALDGTSMVANSGSFNTDLSSQAS